MAPESAMINIRLSPLYSRKASRCEVSLPLCTKKCRFIVSWHFSAYLD
jgi:hypothetical protein